MSSKLFFIIIFFTAALQVNAEIVTPRCSLRGKQITQLAAKITAINSDELPEAYLNQIELEANLTSEGNQYTGVIEGFYRPSKNVKFSIVPTAIAAVSLERNTHLIYICAEVDESNSYRLEVYFLGKTLQMASAAENLLSNILTKEEIRIVPLQLSVLSLGLDEKPNTAKNIFKLLILPYYLQLKLFSGFANIFSTISGINVERIVLTENSVEVAGGINLDHPDQPKFKKTILLDSPEGKILTEININK